MKATIIYPCWPKLERQTEFHLPPHGPVVLAAALPQDVQVEFFDDNLQQIPFTTDTDVIALSVMLSCQLPRAFEIADRYRALGVPVIMGGIAVMLHSGEAAAHADSVFLGEAEGRMEALFEDLRNKRLRPTYDFMNNHPDIALVGTARRDILARELYNYRGVQMLDLVHASRGCRFRCFPCCSEFLGGRKFRPRPVAKVIAEMEAIPNNRLFIVDNSLAQDKDWLRELFTAMIPLRKIWVSHPILDDDEILALAAEAGCWYVYQAIFDTSEVIRNRIRRLKEHGIGVEGTILLGTDDQDEAALRRLVEFLLEIELEVAEFTILTPFPHSPIRVQLEKEGRILTSDWSRYTADKVVFQPKRMSPEKLQELYYWAWDTFYANGGQQVKMGQLFAKGMLKEVHNGTYRRYDQQRQRAFRRRPGTP